MSDKLDRAEAHVGKLMDDILSIFHPGMKITVLVRDPLHDDRDFMMTSDDPAQASRMIDRRIAAISSTSRGQAFDGAGEGLNEDFLTQLRRVNSERYDVWARQPVMLCEHCGRDRQSAEDAGHNFCAPPFASQEHLFTKSHPHLTVSNDAGIMFDALELGGEVGELLNVVKKLEREDRGWRGSRATPEDFADECADVLICLDKLARRRGVDLAAVTVRKFNATSDKVGLPHKLAALSSAKRGE
ncbi:MazG-like family protein [Sphingobium yanoikuyae]|uniref:MazG-like family protein n=1 Tax=Sphingobium yanoikuyae TaxID=13690 RepID=UPI002FD9A833